jgi:hypothetical protein
LTAAGIIATKLGENAEPLDRDVLLEFCDKFLSRRMLEPALTAWNAMCIHRLVPFATLRPAAGISLTNGEFAAGLERGFNWHTTSVPGISVNIGSGVAEVYFSGKQPDTAEMVVWQWLPILPRREYLLQFEYQTWGVSLPSGLRWQISTDEITELSAQLSNSKWKQEAIHVPASAHPGIARLTLAYSRVPGVGRIEGSLLTRAMRLTALP